MNVNRVEKGYYAISVVYNKTITNPVQEIAKNVILKEGNCYPF